MSTKAFVLLSGGIDSSTCLALAVNSFGRNNTIAMSADYGQRHKKEIECAKSVAKFYAVQHIDIKLGPQPTSNLTDPAGNIPEVSYDELGKGMSPSYHYFRNGQILSLAAAWATFLIDTPKHPDTEGFLYAGVHAEDAQNWAYADCTPEFVGAMANAIFVGTYEKLRLKAPLLEMMKHEIVALGHKLKVPYHLTWSCYIGGDRHCGVCPTCRARKQAFEMAGVADPTEYAK